MLENLKAMQLLGVSFIYHTMFYLTIATWSNILLLIHEDKKAEMQTAFPRYWYKQQLHKQY